MQCDSDVYDRNGKRLREFFVFFVEPVLIFRVVVLVGFDALFAAAATRKAVLWLCNLDTGLKPMRGSLSTRVRVGLGWFSSSESGRSKVGWLVGLPTETGVFEVGRALPGHEAED